MNKPANHLTGEQAGKRAFEPHLQAGGDEEE